MTAEAEPFSRPDRRPPSVAEALGGTVRNPDRNKATSLRFAGQPEADIVPAGFSEDKELAAFQKKELEALKIFFSKTEEGKKMTPANVIKLGQENEVFTLVRKKFSNFPFQYRDLPLLLGMLARGEK